MMNLTRTISILILALCSMNGWAADSQIGPEKPVDELSLMIKQKLYPIAQALIQEQCGQNCPGLKVEPRFNSDPAEDLDNLGFSRAAAVGKKPELKGVSVSVLILDRVPEPERLSLKQALAHRLGNEISVPISVQLKAISALPPALDTQPTPESPMIRLLKSLRPLIWPVSTILLAVMGLLGIWLVHRSRIQLLRETAALERARLNESLATSPAAAASLPIEADNLDNFMNERIKDLEWLIEESAVKTDQDSLRKILQTFPAHVLTAKTTLSERALSVLARLPESSSSGISTDEARVWMRQALDRAHWRRLEEEKNPLVRLDRLNDRQLLGVFRDLESASAKALLVGHLPQERWPALLSHCTPDQRVQIGLMLSGATPPAKGENKAASRRAIEARINAILGAGDHQSERVLEDFSSYLSDSELQKLAQATRKPVSQISMDSLVRDMDPRGILEVCMNIELKTLAMLLARSSDSTRKLALGALPKSFRDRLDPILGSALKDQPNEAQVMVARSRLTSAYRQFAERV
ncbi:MAG: hypothetical protein ACXVBC_03455 [Bdellovibrionota bacterium]